MCKCKNRILQTIPCAISKNKLKMYGRLKCKTLNYKTSFVTLDQVDLQATTLKAKLIQEKIGKLYFIKVTNACSWRNVVRTERQVIDWEKIFAKHKSDKGLIPRP